MTLDRRNLPTAARMPGWEEVAAFVVDWARRLQVVAAKRSTSLVGPETINRSPGSMTVSGRA